MVNGDKVWTVFDVLPSLPPIDAREATFVGSEHDLTLVRRNDGGPVESVREYYRVFDDESEAWAYAAQRLRQHADRILEAAEAAAAKARAATVVKVGL